MLPKETILALRLQIAMDDWPREARENMVQWVKDALKEQRDDERERCAKISDDLARPSVQKAEFPDRTEHERNVGSAIAALISHRIRNPHPF